MQVELIMYGATLTLHVTLLIVFIVTNKYTIIIIVILLLLLIIVQVLVIKTAIRDARYM
jgi:hypothetical protein